MFCIFHFLFIIAFVTKGRQCMSAHAISSVLFVSLYNFSLSIAPLRSYFFYFPIPLSLSCYLSLSFLFPTFSLLFPTFSLPLFSHSLSHLLSASLLFSLSSSTSSLSFVPSSSLSLSSVSNSNLQRSLSCECTFFLPLSFLSLLFPLPYAISHCH